MIAQYEEQVYAGVLGKVIGVYMGRPFEGWDKAALEEKWGLVNRYVHEDVNVPLVVSDDDISGTFTFIRAMEDSGDYAETTAEAFGEAWLNYIVENKSILWWGGPGSSTEHTAYLRLKSGIPAPRSGSIALNGQVVAEQIGAQIFCDGFGLVAPGNPHLAASLAQRAASVSHDGEAVLAAMVVAAMVSAAFEDKDMDRLLDIGVSVIPAEALIARVHRDVRGWCRVDGDWRTTYARIHEEYGPKRYWGGPHIVPNHAIMVMAWCYAPDDFQLSQAIIHTAGWDTDCNAGNVGSVMGVKLGLAGIQAQYDFQGPMADRMIIPTAEGTRGISDVLIEALHLARIGRRVMGWDAVPAARGNAFFHFDMPGALHGFMSEEQAFISRGTAEVANVAAGTASSSRAMRLRYRELSDGRIARVSTPMLAVQSRKSGPYAHMAVPRLYPGMTVTVHGRAGEQHGEQAELRLFTRHLAQSEESLPPLCYSSPSVLASDQSFVLEFTVPDTGLPVLDLGLEICGRDRGVGELFVDRVEISGQPSFIIPDHLPLLNGEAPGWISSMRSIGYWNFLNDDRDMMELVADDIPSVFITGTTDWQDYTLRANLGIHMADEAGLIVRYQGLRRYYALVQRAGKFQLIRQLYGESVLAEVAHEWATDDFHHLRLCCQGNTFTAYCDDRLLFTVNDTSFAGGGAGFFARMGKIAYRDAAIEL